MRTRKLSHLTHSNSHRIQRLNSRIIVRQAHKKDHIISTRNMKILFGVVVICKILFVGLASAVVDNRSDKADERPNIIVVMADDMGFSDLGCYGSEIKTPASDRLAADGIRFSQFFNCAPAA